MVAPLITATALTGLSGFLTANAEQRQAEEQRIADEAKNKRSRGSLTGYGYTPYSESYTPYTATPYTSKFQPQQEQILSQYLSGELSPAQTQLLAEQRTTGEESIRRTAAERGTPAGGQQALNTQLGSRIALGALQQTEANKRIGLEYGQGYDQFRAGQVARGQDIEREERRAEFEYGLGDYLRGQEAANRRRELQAQYA